MTPAPPAEAAATVDESGTIRYDSDDLGNQAAADRAVLLALYEATDGPNWEINTNWRSDKPLRNWHGVTTDGDGRVTRLELAWNNLTGILPAALGDLANLQSLALYLNQLSGPIPAALGDLANLQSLVLYHNQLSGPIPATLGNLTNLEELNLGRNQLSGPIPAALGDLANLQSLALHHNQLSGPIPAALGDLANLQSLALHHNQLSGPIPATLGNLTNLEHLALWGGNQLSGPIPPALGRFKADPQRAALMALYEATDGPNWRDNTNWGSIAPLRDWYGILTDFDGHVTQLTLFSNNLSGTLPLALGNLTNLQALRLAGNQLLNGPVPAELGNLTNLSTLHLHNNQLSGPIPAALSNLTNLWSLALGGNQLSGEIPAALGNLTRLRKLYLHSNQLSGPIPATLGNLTNLMELHLGGNQLSGPIPATLGNPTNLMELHLGGNQLSGEIPPTLGSLVRLRLTRFANNPELAGCVPYGLRYLLAAPNYPVAYDTSFPAHDFLTVGANSDGDTADAGDTPSLSLPFCLLRDLHLSGAPLDPPFGDDPAVYAAAVAADVAETAVTATPHGAGDRVTIRKRETTYASGAALPLDLGPNCITVEVTPSDGTLSQTITVAVTRGGAPPSTSGSVTLTLRQGGDFYAVPAGTCTKAAYLFGGTDVTSAWFYTSDRGWIAYDPGTGLEDFPIVGGDVLWIVAPRAQVVGG